LYSPGRKLDRHGVRELALVAAGLLIYYLIRGFVADEFAEARAHALAIVQVEQALHVFHEPQLQRLLDGSLLQIQFWDAIYFWGHAPIIITVGLWLYLQHRSHYSLIRNSFLLSALAGLLVYWLFPVAPPRLLPSLGFVDTMQRYSSISYQAQSLKPFVNEFAAVPSLHFGWSLLIGFGIIRTVQHPIGRACGALLPVLMLIAVIATANHFVFDAAAGFVICLAALGGAIAHQRWQFARTTVRPAARQKRLAAHEVAPV
jgi:PAP2 superfamily